MGGNGRSGRVVGRLISDGRRSGNPGRSRVGDGRSGRVVGRVISDGRRSGILGRVVGRVVSVGEGEISGFWGTDRAGVRCGIDGVRVDGRGERSVGLTVALVSGRNVDFGTVAGGAER